MTNYPDYEGYEELGRFTPAQLQAYREMLLEKTNDQVRFIGKQVWRALNRKPLTVLEIGSGNGRLLVGLAMERMLEEGIGIELSSSRHGFASRWVWELGYGSRIYLMNVDVLKVAEMGLYHNADTTPDLAVCITGCFQYFYPIAPDAPGKVLSFMRNSARFALFELYKKPQMGRTWKVLPEGDRWKYLLDDYDEIGDWVVHTKTFIGEDNNGKFMHDHKEESLAYYSMPVFLKKLKMHGFNNVHWAKEGRDSFVVLVS